MSFPQQNGAGSTWLLTDGHAGNLRQAEALARALGHTPLVPALAPTAPWRWFAPRVLPGAGRAFGPDFSRWANAVPPPALAIGCGRQGALATRLLRARGAHAVQILDPRVDTRGWDLVIAPEHDRLRGANVLPVLGSLNPVDDAWLAEAAIAFGNLPALPGPRVALLVGAPTRQAAWDLREFTMMAGKLKAQLQACGGSLLATVSRRTPEPLRRALGELMHDLPGLFWDGAGANPYPGLLACADRLVCTADSVNMLSEACATTAPVYTFGARHARGRVGNYLDALSRRGRVRPFDGDLAPFAVEPIRETARIAAQVRQRLALP